jgi:hypothetical protein
MRRTQSPCPWALANSRFAFVRGDRRVKVLREKVGLPE